MRADAKMTNAPAIHSALLSSSGRNRAKTGEGTIWGLGGGWRFRVVNRII